MNLLTEYLLYGALEIKEYHANKTLKTAVSAINNEFNTRILAMADKDLVDFVRKRAIDIEATLFYHFHKDNQNPNKIASDYTTRSRALCLNLKDEGNFELRYKILSGALTSKVLCTIDETELASYIVKKKKEALEREFSKAHEIVENEKIIVKNHKVSQPANRGSLS